MSGLGIVSDAKAALTLLVEVAQGCKKRVVCRVVKNGSPTASSQTHFAAQNPLRQRAGETAARYEEMNKAFGRDVCYVTTIGRHKSLRHKCCMSLKTATGSTWAGRPAGLDHSGGAGGLCRCPERKVVAISGDFDFQFLIEDWPLAHSSTFRTSMYWSITPSGADSPVAARV